MKEVFFRAVWKDLNCMFLSMLVVVGCFAQDHKSWNPENTNDLEAFLQQYLANGVAGVDATTRYSFSPVDLNNDGIPEFIVYVTGTRRCGSGGCLALILKREQSTFSVITRITLVRLPIRILPTKTKSWYDISVWVQGGGIQPGYAAVLPFDGEKYPLNPSVAPAKQLDEGADPGRIVALRDSGKLLYP